MRIAAVQLHIDHKDKQSNFDRVENFMAKAAKQQIDLIVFPEFFHGGPGRKSSLPNGRERFQELARRYNMDVVTGSLVENRDGKMYNAIYYIDNTGNVLLDYCKVHLWLTERRYLTPGPHEYKTARNRFGVVVGVCACWDMMFNEVFRSMAMDQGAQLIIAPTYWTIGDFEDDDGVVTQKYDSAFEARLLNSLCNTRAHENECCVVLCNMAYQSDKDRPQPFGMSAGCTQITVPFLGPVAECQHHREEMIIADVDIHTLTADIEKAYQIRRDWNQGNVFNGGPRAAKL